MIYCVGDNPIELQRKEREEYIPRFLSMVFNELKHVLDHFQYRGTYAGVEELQSGNINATYRLSYTENGKPVSYVLQKINTVAFQDPVGLMKNIEAVIGHIAAAMEKKGMDPERHLLRFIPTDNGSLLYHDKNDAYWRSYVFIDNATAYDRIENPRHFYEAGRGFGEFQKYLIDFPADTLTETIPGFHNTKKRFFDFVNAVSADRAGRVAGLEAEIDFFFDRRKMMNRIVDLIGAGRLPLRVTHNDTKLNNVLLDNTTGKALCVIDLDTVMPGSPLYDYGDAIRYGANRAAEDEPDLSRISLDMELFKAFTEGFISETAGTLTDEELQFLPLGVEVLTCELAMRFLTDYLNGDEYFKIKYPDHNLVRARAQMQLLRDIEEKYEDMCRYIQALISTL